MSGGGRKGERFDACCVRKEHRVAGLGKRAEGTYVRSTVQALSALLDRCLVLCRASAAAALAPACLPMPTAEGRAAAYPTLSLPHATGPSLSSTCRTRAERWAHWLAGAKGGSGRALHCTEAPQLPAGPCCFPSAGCTAAPEGPLRCSSQQQHHERCPAPELPCIPFLSPIAAPSPRPRATHR